MTHRILIAALIIFAPHFALAASFELGLSSASAALGDVIRIPVYVNAEEEPVVIADARIQFPRDLLWVKSFTIAPSWVAVSGETYNYVDNGSGVTRATAGFEEGIHGHTLFGELELIAIGAGVADVRVLPDSSLLDAHNRDVLADTKEAHTQIEIAVPSAGSTLQLFDIRLLLAESVLARGEPVVARVSFQSFGQVPTPVDMFFTVTDESGKIFASAKESLVVETEAVFTKELESLDLPSGEYVLHVNTRYNGSVEDDFHAPFRVSSRFSPFLIVFGAVLVALFGLLIISKRHNYGHESK